MYKCMNCGNTEKFIGHAEEKGNVLIYKNEFENFTEPYSWVYMISEKNWDSKLTIDKCFYCQSKNIVKL